MQGQNSNTNTQNVNANSNSQSANTNTNSNSANANTGGNANATNTTGTKPPPCPAADATASHADDAYVQVNRFTAGTPNNSNSAITNNGRTKEVELGNVVTVEGDFRTLLAQAACEKKSVVLYLDDRPLKDVTAYPPSDPSGSVLRFTLKRTEESRDVWTYILGKPGWTPRATKVSVGLPDRYAIDSIAVVNLNVIPHGWFVFWFLLFVVLVIAFIVLAIKSNLLRDSGVSLEQGGRRPFSLARSQAALWFFLVVASYLFIGMTTGDFNTTITTTVLGLIGISAGTAVGAAMIDASKATSEAAADNAASIRSLQDRLGQLDIEIQNAQQALAADANDAAAQATLASAREEKMQRESQLKKLKNQAENFLMDILSDANGVSFHRFQIAAWTIVLGIIFVAQVYRVLAMPDFNGSLLALLGISAGTYIGLKIPEASVPK